MAAFQLTLTRGERKAIDWVGFRYAHGDDLSDLLYLCYVQDYENDPWHLDGDMTFDLEAYHVEKLQAIIVEDNLACFSEDLRHKLNSVVHNFNRG